MNVHLVKWGQVGFCMQTCYFSSARRGGGGTGACRQFWGGWCTGPFSAGASRQRVLICPWRPGANGPTDCGERVRGGGRGGGGVWGQVASRGRRRPPFAAGSGGAGDARPLRGMLAFRRPRGAAWGCPVPPGRGCSLLGGPGARWGHRFAAGRGR